MTCDQIVSAAKGLRRGSEQTRPRVYKAFFMLNSIEHEIFPAHKC